VCDTSSPGPAGGLWENLTRPPRDLSIVVVVTIIVVIIIYVMVWQFISQACTFSFLVCILVTE
jgi:hypothetical protein